LSDGTIILHHYPQSPVSEKVRIVLGMKDLDWRSVEIPRLPPKPNLMPLTGGYRLTPTLQIGADVYCDTKSILRELERRFPGDGFATGFDWGFGQWTDGPLFQDVVGVALVEMSPNMPSEFLADRGPLYFGADFSLENIRDRYNESLANVRAQFGWIDAHLAGREFVSGTAPGLADAFAYYLIWFLRDRMAEGEAFLGQFENLVAWEARVKAIGHGRPEDMSDLAALDIAREAEPRTPERADPNDPMGLEVGERVGVAPASGGPIVSGTVHSVSADEIALMREDERIGRVCTHFPRIGHRVTRP